MTTPENNTAAARTVSVWTWAALLIALTALVGSLLLSIALNLKACPLCFYQRTFVMGVVGVLGVGLSMRGIRSGLLSVLALAPAVGGLGVALFHVYQEGRGKMECPPGLFDLGTAPQQSLAVLALLVVLLLIDGQRSIKAHEVGLPTVLAAVVLGGVFTVAAIMSSSPPCPPDYSKPLDGCRPPNPAAKQT